MNYREYMHIEKFGSEEVEGIELGTCYLFPKIDGTAAVVFVNDQDEIQAGSRKRHLTLEKDNAQFLQSVLNDKQFDGVKNLLKDQPNLLIYSEWLVPHSLKTYKETAWRKSYVYDIFKVDGENSRYLTYDEYEPLCKQYGIEYIPCLAKITNGTYEQFIHIVNQNNYLIEDGKGIGEGCVIKNYSYTNKYGRTVFAKIVTAEFKEKHIKEMGPNEISNIIIEDVIVQKYCSDAFIDKTKAKIINEVGEWSNKLISRLIETCFRDLVVEETYNIVKELKQPKIDFKILRHFLVNKVKRNLNI